MPFTRRCGLSSRHPNPLDVSLRGTGAPLARLEVRLLCGGPLTSRHPNPLGHHSGQAHDDESGRRRRVQPRGYVVCCIWVIWVGSIVCYMVDLGGMAEYNHAGTLSCMGDMGG